MLVRLPHGETVRELVWDGEVDAGIGVVVVLLRAEMVVKHDGHGVTSVGLDRALQNQVKDVGGGAPVGVFVESSVGEELEVASRRRWQVHVEQGLLPGLILRLTRTSVCIRVGIVFTRRHGRHSSRQPGTQ